MAYQFLRFELYSRSGKEGRSTDFIFDEVSRVPHACLHVQAPGTPETVFGLDPEGTRQLHDERAAGAKTVRRDKSGKESLKAVRKDQNTLATVVLSHPAFIEEYRSDPKTRSDVHTWEKRSIAWLREKYGAQLISVVRHTDESHPHLHAYILPDDPQMRAGLLHPGYAAKNTVLERGAHTGEDKKALSKRANLTYVASLRTWLDEYHAKVATPCGLTRLGAGKRRLTRAQWQAEKRQAASLKLALDRAEAVERKAKGYVERTKARAHGIIADAEKVKAEAEIFRGLGGAIRAVVDGARESSVRKAVESEYATRVEAVKAAATQAKADADRARAEQREAEKKAAEQRHALRRQAQSLAAARQEIRKLSDALAEATYEPEHKFGGPAL